MHRKQVWQYACDYCRKKSCSASHMSRHEKGCTGNPCRECRMCKHAGLRQASIRELLIAVNADIEACEPDDIGIKVVCEFDHLEEVANGCPACMLFAVRIAEVIPGDFIHCWIDYQERKKSFWGKIQERDRDDEMHRRDYYQGISVM